MNATATPPVLDQAAADPLGYNTNKLRVLAGALALKKGGKGLSRDCTRALDATLAVFERGAAPAGAVQLIFSALAMARLASKVRHLADQAVEALEALEKLTRTVPIRWFQDKPTTLAQACAIVRRDNPGTRPAVWTDGAQWTDGKVLLLGDAKRPVAPALLRAVSAQPVVGSAAGNAMPEFRSNLERYGKEPRPYATRALYGKPWSNAQTVVVVRDGNDLLASYFAGHNVAILKAHGAKVYRLVSFYDLSRRSSGRERTILAAWTAEGEPVGFAMSISYAGKEAQLEAAALAAGATWGQL